MSFLQARAQHVLVERAVDRDHAADALQREPQAQRDRLEILRGDEDEQRVALAAVGHARRDQAERGEGELIVQRQLHHAGVQCLRRVVEQKAAAGHHALRIDRKTDPVRRHKADVDVERTGIAVLDGRGQAQPEVRRGEPDRTDAAAERRAGFEDQIGRVRRSGGGAQRQAAGLGW